MKRKWKIISIVLMLIIVGCICTLCSQEKETVLTASTLSNKYRILVDVEESKLYVFENGVCTKTYTCSGGKYSTPSPIGTWTIISKGKWGEGFGGSWLRI